MDKELLLEWEDDAVEVKPTLPSEMSERDYRYLTFLSQRRTQAVFAALAAVPPDLLVSFFKSQGVDEQVVGELESVSVGLDFLKEKYSMTDADNITPERTIVRA